MCTCGLKHADTIARSSCVTLKVISNPFMNLEQLEWVFSFLYRVFQEEVWPLSSKYSWPCSCVSSLVSVHCVLNAWRNMM